MVLENGSAFLSENYQHYFREFYRTDLLFLNITYHFIIINSTITSSSSLLYCLSSTTTWQKWSTFLTSIKPSRQHYGVGVITPSSCRKKLKIRDDTLFGQVHLDYKWLDLNEFKPKSKSKSLSLNHYTLLHLRKVTQTHTFFQVILDSKVISRFKYHLAN